MDAIGRNATTATIAKEDRDGEDAPQHGDTTASGAGARRAGSPCVGRVRAALDTLFGTLRAMIRVCLGAARPLP